MSQGDLIHAYMGGRLSRRTFVRRLVAGGVSFGAAVSYAHLLGQDRAAARGGFETHHEIPNVKGTILNQDLDRVIERERVKVRYSVPRRAKLEFSIYLRRPERESTWGYYSLIGYGELKTDGPVDGKTTSVPLDVNPPSSVDALRGRTSAELHLTTIARRKKTPTFGAAFHERT